MIAKLNLGWFNSRIVHIRLICLNFVSPTLENMENCLKTYRVDLDKTYRNAANTPSLPRFKVGQKGDMQQHGVDNNKKAGTPQQHKTNYCGPLDTEGA